MALLDQAPGQMRPDKTRAAQDEHAHGTSVALTRLDAGPPTSGRSTIRTERNLRHDSCQAENPLTQI